VFNSGFLGRKKREKGETGGELFSSEQTCPIACVVLGFSWLLGAVINCSKITP
jgi:hypothetical protein